MYPLLPALFLPFAYLEGEGDPLVLQVIMAGVMVLVAGINTMGAWWFLKNKGLPELRQQLEGWLS